MVNFRIAVRALGVLFLCVALAACAADGAGITGAEIDVGLRDNSQTPYVSRVRFTDGKEKETVFVSVTFKDGKPVVNYRAVGVRAFEGQKVRAEVHKALSAAGVKVAPAALDVILKTLGGL